MAFLGKLLTCRSNEVLKLWGPSTNEQIVNSRWDANEMPWKHPCTTAWMNQWRNANEPMSSWANESMNQWTDEDDESINQSINQWTKESVNQPIKESMKPWVHEFMNQRTNESMNQWLIESTNQRINYTMKQWIGESINHWTNESMNRRFLADNFPRSTRGSAETQTEATTPKKYRVSRPRVFSPVKSHASELLRFPATWWWVVDMMMWLTWWCGC